MIDINQITALADGRWFEILEYYGIETRKPMKLGPCPVCGGKDRAHFKKDGALYCRMCPRELQFPSNVLMQVCGWNFKQFCDEMGKYLMITESEEPIIYYKGQCGLTSKEVREANEKYEEVKSNERYVPFYAGSDLITLQYINGHRRVWMHSKTPDCGAEHSIGNGGVIVVDDYEDFLELKRRGLADMFKLVYSAGRMEMTVITYQVKELVSVFVNPGDLLELARAANVNASSVTTFNAKGEVIKINLKKVKKILASKKVIVNN